MLGQTRRRRNHERGQTTLDLAIGASLFLLIATSVLLTATQLSAPSGEERPASPVAPLTSDRIADHLTADRLGDAEATGTLDEEAVAVFFGGRDDRLGSELPGDRDRINVSVTDLERGVTIGERGPLVPDERPTTTARRAVRYDESIHWLTVEVW